MDSNPDFEQAGVAFILGAKLEKALHKFNSSEAKQELIAKGINAHEASKGAIIDVANITAKPRATAPMHVKKVKGPDHIATSGKSARKNNKRKRGMTNSTAGTTQSNTTAS